MMNYKRILCIICVLLCLMSTLVLPSAATSANRIPLNVTVARSTSGVYSWFICNEENATPLKSVVQKNTSFSYAHNVKENASIGGYDVTVKSDFVSRFNARSRDPENDYVALLFDVTLSGDTENIDYSDYKLEFNINWNTDFSDIIADDIQNFLSLYYDLNIDRSDPLYKEEDDFGFPQIGSLTGSTLDRNYGYFQNDSQNRICPYVTNGIYRQKYIFDGEILYELLGGPFTLALPWSNISGAVSNLYITAELIEQSEDTTAPDVTDTPNVPDEPGTGITDKDLEDAYNKGFNEGLNKGQDKNYVYGFVNGTWSAVLDTYDILAKGISIGGITLGNIVTSIIIIAVLVIVIKKVT